METLKNHGFTVIELLIVIMVLGIIAITALVKNPGTSPNYYAEAERVASDVRYAQSLAMSRAKKYKIVPSGNSYSIMDSSGNVEYSVTLTQGYLVMFNTYAGAQCSELVFNSKGDLDYPSITNIAINVCPNTADPGGFISIAVGGFGGMIIPTLKTNYNNCSSISSLS